MIKITLFHTSIIVYETPRRPLLDGSVAELPVQQASLTFDCSLDCGSVWFKGTASILFFLSLSVIDSNCLLFRLLFLGFNTLILFFVFDLVEIFADSFAGPKDFKGRLCEASTFKVFDMFLLGVFSSLIAIVFLPGGHCSSWEKKCPTSSRALVVD